MERPSLQSFVFKDHKDLSECQDSCPLFEDNVTRLSVHESINIPKAYWQMGDSETSAQSIRGHRGLWKYFLQTSGEDPNFHFPVSLKQPHIFSYSQRIWYFPLFCHRDATSFTILIPKPVIICIGISICVRKYYTSKVIFYDTIFAMLHFWEQSRGDKIHSIQW